MFIVNFDCNSLGPRMQLGCETMGDVRQLTLYQGIPHLSKDCHIVIARFTLYLFFLCYYLNINFGNLLPFLINQVKIRGTLRKHAYPIGMGPGLE